LRSGGDGQRGERKEVGPDSEHRRGVEKEVAGTVLASSCKALKIVRRACEQSDGGMKLANEEGVALGML
jgi:hypothetical protein